MVKTNADTDTGGARLRRALRSDDASARLQAALTAGTAPDPGSVDVLVDRCAIEPDFYVRDMLTWALTRQDRERTLGAVLSQLDSEIGQARSQALHTLSKLGDPRAWPAITRELLRDDDTEVARAAWRVAAGLVPAGRESELAAMLATQFGRGDRETRRSLSRAFAVLGDPALPVVERAADGPDREVGAHALATLSIMADPEAGFDAAIAEADRIVALRAAPASAGIPDPAGLDAAILDAAAARG